MVGGPRGRVHRVNENEIVCRDLNVLDRTSEHHSMHRHMACHFVNLVDLFIVFSLAGQIFSHACRIIMYK